MLVGYADDVITTVSFFEAQGPRGLIDSAGGLKPAAGLFTRLARLRGRPIAVLGWPGQPRLRGFSIAGGGGVDYCIANLHHERAEVPLPGGRAVPIEGFGTIWADGKA